METIETLTIRTSSREELVDITDQIQGVVGNWAIRSGMVWVYCPHTTAAITIQENADPDVKTDLLHHLRQLVPQRGDFRHSEGNSDAHIKSSLIGPSQAVPIKDGRLVLGTWQGLFFCEFDGPRNRRVIVKGLAG